jgi:two-component system, LytTR family, response regulator
MRVLIADRESRERTMLADLCHIHREVESVTAVASGKEALAQIRANSTDIVFLACQLEDMMGFDVLQALNASVRPATVMLATDDRYAAEALSAAATDYVIQPISPYRLALALKRAASATRRVTPQSSAKRMASVEKTAAAYGDFLPIGYGDRLVGERASRLHFFSPLDIDYIEADSNYVLLHVGAERYLSRDSLTRLSRQLANLGFVRISRALLLNLQRVSFAQREGRGVLTFTLQSGERVVSSAGFRLESGAHLRIARTRGTRRESSAREPSAEGRQTSSKTAADGDSRAAVQDNLIVAVQ